MIPKVENPFAWIVVLNAIRMVTGSNIKNPYLIETIYERRKNSNLNVPSDGTKATYDNTFSIKTYSPAKLSRYFTIFKDIYFQMPRLIEIFTPSKGKLR